jgi:putative membrane protein
VLITAFTGLVIAADPADRQPARDADKADRVKEEKLPTNSREFAMMAAQGGLFEVKSSELADKNAASEDVKKFAAHMVKDHTAANDELKRVAAGKNIELPQALDEKHQAKLDKLTKSTGAEFDKEYMTIQVKAHAKTIRMFEAEAKSGSDNDIKAFADKTLPTLREHMKHAREVAGKVGATIEDDARTAGEKVEPGQPRRDNDRLRT